MATTSPKFSLNKQDLVKGLLMAILPSVLEILGSFATGNFKINWTEQWHMAVSAGAAYLLKNYFSGPQPPTSSTNSGMVGKVVVFILVLCLLGSLCKAQSMFKPLPIYKKPVQTNRFFRAIGPTDSLPSLANGKFQGFRFAGPDLAFAIPDFSIYTGLGIDYVWATANQTTGKWEYTTTLGPRVYGGANLSTPTVRTIGAVGVRLTLFKGWLALGAIYNLTLKKGQGTIGNPAALIPGLN